MSPLNSILTIPFCVASLSERGPTTTTSFTPQNTSPLDDAPRSPTYSAPAPVEIPWSTARQTSLPASAKQITSSDLPDSGTPDTQTNTATRDTSDETSRECSASPPRQSPNLRASSCADTRHTTPR